MFWLITWNVTSVADQKNVEIALGAALVVGAAAVLLVAAGYWLLTRQPWRAREPVPALAGPAAEPAGSADSATGPLDDVPVR
jgi:hypothetical protein